MPTLEYFSFLAKKVFHFATPWREGGQGEGGGGEGMKVRSGGRQRPRRAERASERKQTDLELGWRQTSEIVREVVRLEAACDEGARGIGASPE